MTTLTSRRCAASGSAGRGCAIRGRCSSASACNWAKGWSRPRSGRAIARISASCSARSIDRAEDDAAICDASGASGAAAAEERGAGGARAEQGQESDGRGNGRSGARAAQGMAGLRQGG